MKASKLLICGILSVFIAGCASTNQENPDLGFISNQLGILNQQEDLELNSQVLMGLNSASKIKRYVEPEKLKDCKAVFNSYQLLTALPFTEEQSKKYIELTTVELQSSKKVTFSYPDHADCGILTAYSIISIEGRDDKLGELIIYVFDWDKVKSSGVKGTNAFIKGGVWSLVNRHAVPSTVIDGDDLYYYYKEALHSSMEILLVTI